MNMVFIFNVKSFNDARGISNNNNNNNNHTYVIITMIFALQFKKNT